MPSKNYLIVNAYGRSNRGDSVLLDECIRDIKIHDPDARIEGVVFEGIEAVSARHPEIKRSERLGNPLSVSGKRRTLEKLVFVLIAGLAASARLKRLEKYLPARQRQTMEALRRADVVVSAPGGYIHDTNLAYLLALFHINLATRMGKPVLLAPQSIGPIKSCLARYLTRRILSKTATVCVREGYSYTFLREELKISESVIRRTGDSAFWSDEVLCNTALINAQLARLGVGPSDQFLGMTVVGWNYPRSRDAGADEAKYVSGMAEVIRHTWETHRLRTVIFNQVSDDVPTARAVAKLAGAAAIVDDGASEPPLLRGMIARSRAFVGTRFHSCIFALIAGRPTYAVAYLPKTEHIMRDLGLAHRFVDITQFRSQPIIDQVDSDLVALRSAEREIAGAVEAYRSNQVQFCNIIDAPAKAAR